MKLKKLKLISIFGTIVFSLTAQTATRNIDSFRPIYPQIMAIGGTSTTAATGFSALFTNPAVFAIPGREEATVLSFTATPYFTLGNSLSVAKTYTSDNPSESDLEKTENQLLEEGIGVRFTAGTAYVGHGVGVGLIADADLVFTGGNDITEVYGLYDDTLALILGYSFGFEVFSVPVYIGGDVRPMIKIYSDITSEYSSSFLNDFFKVGNEPPAKVLLSGSQAWYGWGLGVDLGFATEIGPFVFGLSARDIGNTPLHYMSTTIDNASDLLSSGVLPTENKNNSFEIVMPMALNAGISFHPDLGSVSPIMDPSLHMDVQDFTSITDLNEVLSAVHAGTSITLFKLVDVRAGINQGFFTFGGGINIPFFNFNIAAFKHIKMLGSDDIGLSGLSAEVAIRF